MAKQMVFLDFEEEIDFQLFGIVSNLNEPSLFAFKSNVEFQTFFERQTDLNVWMNQNEVYFPVFKWDDEQTNSTFYLIKNLGYLNKTNNELTDLSSLFDVNPTLIQTYSQYDYFLKVDESISIDEIPMKENFFIQKFTKLDLNKVKNKNYLIF